MAGKIILKSPEGEECELVSSGDDKILEGAELGVQALLNLLFDDLDLEEGYEVLLVQS